MNSFQKEKIDSCLSNIEGLVKKNLSGALRKLNSVKSISEQTNYRLPEILYRLSSCYNYSGNIEKAIHFIEKSLELQKDKSDIKILGELLSHYGNVLGNLGNYEKSLEVLNKAQEIQIKSGDKRSLVYTYLRIGNVHRVFFNSSDQSILIYKSALKLSEELKNDYLTALCLGSLANAYLYKRNYSSAKEFYILAGKIFERINDTSQHCLVLLGLGTVYRKFNDYDSSINCLQKGLRILKKNKNLKLETSLSLNLAISYLEIGDEKKFNNYYKKSIRMIKKVGDKILASSLYKGLTDVYENKKDYKNAYYHFLKYYELYSDIFKEESERVNKILRLKYEKEKSERETEIYRLKTQELTREVEAKTKELNAMASYLSQKNEFVKNLVTNVKKDFLDFKVEEKISDYLNSAVKKAESASNLNDDFKRFETELDKFSFSFIEKLSKKFPSLTRVELKICSMIKINLSSKEIANLLFLSRRTVENHKYRIYKKIRLKSNQNIAAYLNSI